MSNPIEVVQNLVLDTLEPFMLRLAALEEQVGTLESIAISDAEVEAARATQAAYQEAADEMTPESHANGATVLPAAVEEILALHRLDATPQQWVFRGGKREQAPEGMWEITCAVCSDHKIDWREGDPEPPRCKTVKILTRGY
jgi:hypothetical protein